MVFLVWALGPRIEGIDVHRAMEIALLHDLAELRVGDLPRTASRYFPAGAKNAAESAAMADVLAPAGRRARSRSTRSTSGGRPPRPAWSRPATSSS